MFSTRFNNLDVNMFLIKASLQSFRGLFSESHHERSPMLFAAAFCYGVVRDSERFTKTNQGSSIGPCATGPATYSLLLSENITRGLFRPRSPLFSNTSVLPPMAEARVACRGYSPAKHLEAKTRIFPFPPLPVPCTCFCASLRPFCLLGPLLMNH